jgi:DNA-binding IclR family transcriptional regulator
VHATSSGKVLLAYAPDRVRDELLSGRLERYTAATLTASAALRTQLEQVRTRGWAATAEEYETGLNAVAAPVRDATGDVVAAVSVSGPAFRMPVDSFADVAPRVVAAADALSRRLGHFG